MKKFFYRVQQGDTLSSIAQNFNAPIGRLIHANNLKKDVLAGDIILIEKVDNVYLVKPLDTLESLSKRFNITPQKILDKNNIEYIYCGLLIEI